MAATEGFRVERDSGDMSLEAFMAGAPISDAIRAVEPQVMAEITPHLLDEMLTSLGGNRSIDELNLIAKSLVDGLNRIDGMRKQARLRRTFETITSSGDFDY